MVALPFSGKSEIARRHSIAIMPAIGMAWSGRGWSALSGIRGRSPRRVRVLQYVMQQTGNLLIFVPALVGNKTGHGYLMAE